MLERVSPFFLFADPLFFKNPSALAVKIKSFVLDTSLGFFFHWFDLNWVSKFLIVFSNHFLAPSFSKASFITRSVFNKILFGFSGFYCRRNGHRIFIKIWIGFPYFLFFLFFKAFFITQSVFNKILFAFSSFPCRRNSRGVSIKIYSVTISLVCTYTGHQLKNIFDVLQRTGVIYHL